MIRLALGTPIVIRQVLIDGPLGRRGIDMILDTGATYTSISWSVALDIGYDPAVSPRRVSTITANGIIELPLITVDRMEIEGLETENIDVTCQDIPELAGVEGLLGLSFLKRFRSVIDYKSGFLEID